MLHEQFGKLLSKYEIEKRFIAPLKTQLSNTFEYYNKSNKDDIAKLKYSLKTIDEKIDKIEERFVIGEIDGSLYTKFIKKFNEEKENLNITIQKSGFESSNLENYINNSIKLLSNLNNTWASLDYAGK